MVTANNRKENNIMNYDSKKDTLKHIYSVKEKLMVIILNLATRAEEHDLSKLSSPEKKVFDKVTPKLRELEYGSEEYKEQLKEMGVALEHHYSNNRHHPEHFENGINDMNLVDVIEMFCDWLAATERHNTGDIMASININQKRFGMSDELANIFKNTVKDVFKINSDNLV